MTHWIARKERLPEDDTLCLFHIEWRKSYNVSFGFFWHGNFIEKDTCKMWRTYNVDYWMGIPLLPKE